MNDIEKKMRDAYDRCSPNDKFNGELCFSLYWDAFRKYCAISLVKWDDIDYKQKLVWVSVAQGFEPIWAKKQE